jgi:hypothetical protein
MRAYGCGAPHRALESQESTKTLRDEHANAISTQSEGMKALGTEIIANQATIAEWERKVRGFRAGRISRHATSSPRSARWFAE